MIYIAIACGVIHFLSLVLGHRELAILAALTVIILEVWPKTPRSGVRGTICGLRSSSYNMWYDPSIKQDFSATLLAWHLPSIDASMVSLENRNRWVEDRVALVREFTQATEPDAVFLSRQYHDLIIVYGERSALLYTLFATPDPISQTYLLEEYEPRLVEVVSKLLASGIPVYVVIEPKGRIFLQGPINPYPILSVHFRMIPFRTETDPVIYQVDFIETGPKA